MFSMPMTRALVGGMKDSQSAMYSALPSVELMVKAFPFNRHSIRQYEFTRNPGHDRSRRIFEFPDNAAWAARESFPDNIRIAASRLLNASSYRGNAPFKAVGLWVRRHRLLP